MISSRFPGPKSSRDYRPFGRWCIRVSKLVEPHWNGASKLAKKRQNQRPSKPASVAPAVTPMDPDDKDLPEPIAQANQRLKNPAIISRWRQWIAKAPVAPAMTSSHEEDTTPRMRWLAVHRLIPIISYQRRICWNKCHQLIKRRRLTPLMRILKFWNKRWIVLALMLKLRMLFGTICDWYELHPAIGVKVSRIVNSGWLSWL